MTRTVSWIVSKTSFKAVKQIQNLLYNAVFPWAMVCSLRTLIYDHPYLNSAHSDSILDGWLSWRDILTKTFFQNTENAACTFGHLFLVSNWYSANSSTILDSGGNPCKKWYDVSTSNSRTPPLVETKGFLLNINSTFHR